MTVTITPAAPERRTPAEELLDELLDLPARRRREALKQERFHNPILAELLVDACEEAQPEDPRWAIELAGLAVALEEELARSTGGPGDYVMARCWCLRGNALRLAGRPQRAEQAYLQVYRLLEEPADAAEPCQGLGLLRWEQGRNAEARALFGQAAGLFAEAQHAGEGACYGLLGLLSLEEGATVQALLELQQAEVLREEKSFPSWLGARADLALALCLAETGSRQRARDFCARGLRLAEEIDDAAERLRLRWLQARLTAGLGELEKGLATLREVRASYLERKVLPEAALATLDLARLLAEAGRTEELVFLRSETAAALPERELLLTAPALDELLAGGDEDPREVVHRHAGRLRRLLRLQGVRIEPLPFV